MNTQATTNSTDIPRARLWFGFSGAAFAWILAGFLDATLAWYACLGGEIGWGVFTSFRLRLLLGLITFGLLAIATAGGIISYSNWRRLCNAKSIVEAEGRGRQQFMALTGVFLSVVLGIGIIWFSIPIYILRICERAR